MADAVNSTNFHIRVHAPGGLSGTDWQAWSALQQAHACYDGPSLRPEFTKALSPFRPGLRIAVAEAEGRIVGFLPFIVNLSGHAFPAGQWLMSFQGPVCDPSYSIDAQTWLAGCSVRQLRFDRLVVRSARFADDILLTDDSPVIDLSRGYDEYKRDLKRRGSRLIKRLEQKRRHAERLLSSLELADEAAVPDTLELLISWRRERNREILASDFLTVSWVAPFMRALCEQRDEMFRGRLFVLRLGHRPAAALLALQSRHVLECVVTAFDPLLAPYSPGLLLFHQLVREAGEFGIERIHLTRGTEHFKERFENAHVTVADAVVGQSPTARRMMRAVLAAKQMVWQTRLGHPVRRVWRRVNRVADRVAVREQVWVAGE